MAPLTSEETAACDRLNVPNADIGYGMDNDGPSSTGSFGKHISVEEWETHWAPSNGSEPDDTQDVYPDHL